MTEAERKAVENEMVSLREYLEAKIDFRCIEMLHLKELYETKLDAVNLSHAKFELLLNTRWESMNEIREQLGTQKSESLSRLEYDANHKLLESKIDSIVKIVWTISGTLAALEIVLRFIK